MDKIITKKELADIAGVHASTVTRFVDAHPEVEKRKKVLADHPLVVEFMKRRTSNTRVLVSPGGTVMKIDALYDEVAVWCSTQEAWSANKIKKHFSIGTTRATKLYGALYDAGIKPGAPAPRTPKAAPPVRKVRAKKPREVSTAPAAKTPKRAKPEPKPVTYEEATEQEPRNHGLEELPGDIRALMDWPLNKIIARFGTATGLEMYLKASKTVEEIAEKRAKNAKMYGELIEREIVRRNIFEPLNNALARMLRDGSRSVTSVITQRVKAGDTPEECEAAVMKQLSAFIKPLKKVLGKGIFFE